MKTAEWEKMIRVDRARSFVDTGKMAERSEVVEARLIGWMEGKSKGFANGLAWGIVVTVAFYAVIKVALSWF